MLNAAFSDPVLEAQSTFRAILDAMARPGSVQPIASDLTLPRGINAAAAAVALTLCDHDTPVWLDDGLREDETVAAWLRFHCGCDITDDPGAAAFAFAQNAANIPSFDAFNVGTQDYPDRATTLVLQVRSLRSGAGLVLTGPGIREQTALRAEPLPDDMALRLAGNRGLFPRGIDVLLVAGDAIAALPRTVRVLEEA